MNSVIDTLAKLFERKALQIYRLSQNEFIIGKFIERKTIKDQNGNDRDVIVLERFDNGRVIAIPVTTNIDRSLKLINPKPGGYLYIRFDGTSETADGRTFKLYTVAYMDEDEFNKTIQALQNKQQTSAPQQQATKTTTTKPQLDDKLSEAVEFVTELVEFYGEISYSDIEARLKNRGYSASVDDIKKFAGDKLEFDDQAQLIRYRQ